MTERKMIYQEKRKPKERSSRGIKLTQLTINREYLTFISALPSANDDAKYYLPSLTLHATRYIIYV